MLARHLHELAPGLSPLLMLGIVAALVFVRYLVFAGTALLAVHANRQRLAARRIQDKPFTRAQMMRELGYSALSALVFAGFGAVLFAANSEFGFSRIYNDIAERGWLWFGVSIPLALLVHDFYFYWAHRLMHSRALFRRVHRVHHLSTNPSPLAAFAFHPLEAVLEALGFAVVIAVVPLHPIALLIVSTAMIGFNVIGHLGYELFPPGLASHPVFGLINTATSHNLHHASYRCNYGLYTLIWDRLFGTLHPLYAARYAALSGALAPPERPQQS